MNLSTGEVISTRSDEMNAEATAAHLRQVLAAIPDRPILLLWDRAPWHRGAALRQLLQEHSRLEVMRFPVAAPELNPQERVWKATRQEVSHNHDEARLDGLADRFERHLQRTRFPCSLLDRYGYTYIRSMFT